MKNADQIQETDTEDHLETAEDKSDLKNVISISKVGFEESGILTQCNTRVQSVIISII